MIVTKSRILNTEPQVKKNRNEYPCVGFLLDGCAIFVKLVVSLKNQILDQLHIKTALGLFL